LTINNTINPRLKSLFHKRSFKSNDEHEMIEKTKEQVLWLLLPYIPNISNNVFTINKNLNVKNDIFLI